MPSNDDALYLEGAPIPAAGDTGSNLGDLALGAIEYSVHSAALLRGFGGLSRGSSVIGVGIDGSGALLLGIENALDLVQALAASFFPALVGAPAQIAGPRRNTFGVESSILIERDQMGGVRGAEHMATVAAVMAAEEEAERRAAGRTIAAGRHGIRLPVFSGGKPSHFTKMLGLHPLVLSQLADTVAEVALHGGATGNRRT